MSPASLEIATASLAPVLSSNQPYPFCRTSHGRSGRETAVLATSQNRSSSITETRTLRKNTIRHRAVKIALLTLVVFLKISPQYLVAQKSSQRSSANASLPKVHLDGQYFVRDGKRFFPVGAH